MFKALVLLLMLVMVGCSTMQYTANPQGGSADGVRVLYDYPSDKFKNLGVIDFDYYRPGWREPSVTDALPKLKAKVRSVGGNALIVRNQRVGRFNNRFITISAEVLDVDWSEAKTQ
jgi:hypothetical protein